MLAQLRQCSRTRLQHSRKQIYESSSWFTSSSETNNKCSAETAHILAQRHGVLFKVLRRTYIRGIADSPNHQAWCPAESRVNVCGEGFHPGNLLWKAFETSHRTFRNKIERLFLHRKTDGM